MPSATTAATTNLRASRKQAAAAKKTTAAPAKVVKATPAPKVEKAPETAAIAIPSDPKALQHLVQVTKARRWRAGRRNDTALVAMLDERLALLGASAPGTREVETVDIEVPNNQDDLAHLIKVQRARRYRAGRRGDEGLVAMLDQRIALLEGALDK
jgi:hypothetical protein